MLNRVKKMDGPINAFTIDVEDYYQVSGFEDVIPRERWRDHESRVLSNTYRFLEMLDEYQVKATFFVLGWVADRHPHLVRDIDEAGHEVGCHSYWHHLIYDKSREDFEEDLKRSTHVIEDAIGKKIETFRAPSFSVVEETLWALDVLVEHGYKYDSSIFPSARSRCGISGTSRFPHRIDTDAGPILEFPLTVRPLGKRMIPVGGGGYFRLFPRAVTKYFLHQINDQEQQPFVFYIHPWEIDVQQPKIRSASDPREIAALPESESDGATIANPVDRVPIRHAPRCLRFVEPDARRRPSSLGKQRSATSPHQPPRKQPPRINHRSRVSP